MEKTSEVLSATREKRIYEFFVDDREFQTDKPELTGGEIMDLASIPRSTGLLEILPDGTQRSVPPDEVISLKHERHMKRPPRFKRG